MAPKEIVFSRDIGTNRNLNLDDSEIESKNKSTKETRNEKL